MPCIWTGTTFDPPPRMIQTVNEAYGLGEVVELVAVEDRSDKTHRHEFAWLREAWKNLPETISDEYPTPEHLRKRALIEGGFFDQQVIDAGTNAAALRVAAAIRVRPGSEFSLVIVRGPLVVVRDAKSQSRRAMGKAEFAKSKTAILEIVADLIGVTPEHLSPAARAPAQLNAKSVAGELA